MKNAENFLIRMQKIQQNESSICYTITKDATTIAFKHNHLKTKEMGTFFLKTNFFMERTAEKKNIPNVRYSKTDFFCESQENRTEDRETLLTNEHEEKTDNAEKRHDRFFGHFNRFF
jgi:hypothetical protein